MNQGMGLIIETFVVGPLQNNTYLVGDESSRQAVVIDPGMGCQAVIQRAAQLGWKIKEIWLTHAHFDHLMGAGLVSQSVQPPVETRLHPDDLLLWQEKGGAAYFGFKFDPGPEPSLSFAHGQRIALGESELEIRHAPGHSRGHILIYSSTAGVLFCGDVIFRGSIGRTDLPGGSLEDLLESIQSQVMSLPDATRLLCGHGPESTVGEERSSNPYL